jgi:PTH1 family peptidyl-tRNA hydrolase
MSKTNKILIVGLGNPGENFENTKHNFGFIIVDNFQKKYDFPEFKEDKKLKAQISEKNILGKKVLLAKPLTFMNNSGDSVQVLVKKELNQKNVSGFLLVIHDDLDIKFGEIKIVKNRGSAGHKGVESIMKKIKTQDFARIRLGIGQENKKRITNKQKIKEFVLSSFSQKQKKTLNRVIAKSIEAINIFIKEGLNKAMNEINKG